MSYPNNHSQEIRNSEPINNKTQNAPVALNNLQQFGTNYQVRQLFSDFVIDFTFHAINTHTRPYC